MDRKRLLRDREADEVCGDVGVAMDKVVEPLPLGNGRSQVCTRAKVTITKVIIYNSNHLFIQIIWRLLQVMEHCR